MKNKNLALFLLLFLVSCTAHTSTVSTPSENKYDYITAEKADDAMRNCNPEHHWTMSIGGVSVIVVQVKNCLEIDELLFVVTPNDEYTNEIRSHSVKLIGLHFLEHLKRTTSGKVWSLEQIKELNFPAVNEGERPVWMVLYKINSVPVTCTGNTCQRGSNE